MYNIRSNMLLAKLARLIHYQKCNLPFLKF